MNMMQYLGKGRQLIALTLIVTQLETMNERTTVTRIARALDCSKPTASRYLREAVDAGYLVRDEFNHRKNAIGYRFISVVEFDEYVRVSTSKLMIEYWTQKNNYKTPIKEL